VQRALLAICLIARRHESGSNKNPTHGIGRA
jgi:hypothetical protein